VEKPVKSVNDLKGLASSKSVSWIDIVGLGDMKVFEALGKLFDLHPLILEDVLHTEQRPKFENYDNVLYIVVKMFSLDKKENKINSEQISLILGKHFVISLQERPGDVFEPVRQRIRDGKGVRRRGPDYITYMILDSIVDNYFLVLEQIGERIEELEDELLADPDQKTLHKVNSIRQEAIILRRSIWPLRDVVNRFERDENALVQPGTRIYIRDVYDHTVQVIEAIETYRDILSGMVDLYLSSVSNKLNSVMKVLTVIATIFIPLTWIAGVYGMNFEFMPELGWRFGYPMIITVMFAVGIVMLIYFKRKKWM
jgi:magnesium transporter